MHIKTEPKIHTAKTERTEERKKQFNNSTEIFQHPTFYNERSAHRERSQRKDQQGKRGLEKY